MDLIQQFSNKYKKDEAPSCNVGDTVRVHIRVKEGNRERIQVFEALLSPKSTAVSARLLPSAACPTAWA